MTPTLSAPGIVLRPLVLSDATALFVALGDPDVQLYRRQAAHADGAETERYIARTLARSVAAWAITEDGGEALGRLALRAPEPRAGEFGIVLRAAAHRRGLALAALRLAERHAFGALGFETLRAGIDAANKASLALFAKAGYARVAAAPGISKIGLRESIVVAKHATGD